MATQAQISANRQNARASTGPNTAKGKARVAKNALRHGLSLRPPMSPELIAMAHALCGPGASPDLRSCAFEIVEAQADLRRVREARRQVMTHLTEALHKRPQDQDERDFRDVLTVPVDPDSAEAARAVFEAECAALALIEFGDAAPGLASRSTHSQLVGQLLRLDRYERRAFSRRKQAMRAFNDLQAKASVYGDAARSTFGKTKPIGARRPRNGEQAS